MRESSLRLRPVLRKRLRSSLLAVFQDALHPACRFWLECRLSLALESPLDGHRHAVFAHQAQAVRRRYRRLRCAPREVPRPTRKPQSRLGKASSHLRAEWLFDGMCRCLWGPYVAFSHGSQREKASAMAEAHSNASRGFVTSRLLPRPPWHTSGGTAPRGRPYPPVSVCR